MSSSRLGIIPNFCIGSQPSGIPLILHRLSFGFQLIEAPYIFFHHYYFFQSCSFFLFFSFLILSLLSLSLSLSLSLFLSLSLSLRYVYKRGFGCLNLPPYLSTLTFLGTSGTAGFIRMTWALRCTCNLWVNSTRPTFNGSWSGGTSQAWSTVATRIAVWL